MLEALGLKPIPMFMLSSWVKAAAKCGFNVQPLFKEAGITIDIIRLEEARVSPLQLVSVLEQCVAMSPEKYFPIILGDTFAFESLPEFETLLTTSPTLRDALVVAKMARKVVLPWITIELEEQGDEARVLLGFEVPVPNLASFGLPLHLVTHAIMACVRKFGRNLIGNEDSFREVRFKVTEAETPFAEQIRAFFVVPVKFGQNRPSSWPSSVWAKRPAAREWPPRWKTSSPASLPCWPWAWKKWPTGSTSTPAPCNGA